MTNLKSKKALEALTKKMHELKKEKPELFEDKIWWDYYDKPNVDLRKFKTYEDYYGEVFEEAIDCNFESVSNLTHNKFLEFLELFPDLSNSLEDEDREELKYIFEDIMCIDYNIDELISHKSLYLNIFPYQEDNLDREGGEVSDALDVLWNNIHSETKAEIEEIPECEVLEKLFKSQDFDLYDTIDWDNSDSKFIKSFYKEMLNADLTYTKSQFLVFLIKTDVESYFKIKSGKGKLSWKKGTAGLFNPVHGSGSILELELDKPFEIMFTGEKYFDALQIEGCSCYGYTISEVYGFMRKLWEEAKYSIEEKTN